MRHDGLRIIGANDLAQPLVARQPVIGPIDGYQHDELCELRQARRVSCTFNVAASAPASSSYRNKRAVDGMLMRA
jgi:hypothetical protein